MCSLTLFKTGAVNAVQDKSKGHTKLLVIFSKMKKDGGPTCRENMIQMVDMLNLSRKKLLNKELIFINTRLGYVYIQQMRYLFDKFTNTHNKLLNDLFLYISQQLKTNYVIALLTTFMKINFIKYVLRIFGINTKSNNEAIL